MTFGTPRFFLNADSNAGGGDKSDDKSPPDGAPDGKDKSDDDKVDWKARFEETKSERDNAKTKARKLQEKLDELEKSSKDKDRTDAEKNGDVTKLRESFQQEKDALLTEKQTLLNQLKDRDKREAFLRNANLFTDEAREDVWDLVRGKLDVVEEDGAFNVIVVGDHRPVDDFFKDLASKKPHFAKNPGKTGTGAGGAGEKKGQKASSIPNDFGSWPKEKMKDWMRDNPELAAEAASKALGG